MSNGRSTGTIELDAERSQGGRLPLTRGPALFAAATSPLTRYVQFLIDTPARLERYLDRDAEAIELLRAEPTARPGLLQAAISGQANSKLDRASRVWTREDKRWLALKTGACREGLLPRRRIGRLLETLRPTRGLPLSLVLFRAVLNEARQDGTAAVLVPMLQSSQEALHRLFDAVDIDGLNSQGWRRFKEAEFLIAEEAKRLMLFAPEGSDPAATGSDSVALHSPRVRLTSEAVELIADAVAEATAGEERSDADDESPGSTPGRRRGAPRGMRACTRRFLEFAARHWLENPEATEEVICAAFNRRGGNAKPKTPKALRSALYDHLKLPISDARANPQALIDAITQRGNIQTRA